MEPTDLNKDYIEFRYKEEVILRLKELLESRHLYQNVSLDLSRLENEISNVKDTRHRKLRSFSSSPMGPPEVYDKRKREGLRKILSAFSVAPWEFAYESMQFRDTQEAQRGSGNIGLILPTINIVCKKCKGDPLPHNPGYIGLTANLPELTFYHPSNDKGPIQLFFFPFLCQRCKDEPIIFMVRT